MLNKTVHIKTIIDCFNKLIPIISLTVGRRIHLKSRRHLKPQDRLIPAFCVKLCNHSEESLSILMVFQIAEILNSPLLRRKSRARSVSFNHPYLSLDHSVFINPAVLSNHANHPNLRKANKTCTDIVWHNQSITQ